MLHVTMHAGELHVFLHPQTGAVQPACVPLILSALISSQLEPHYDLPKCARLH